MYVDKLRMMWDDTVMEMISREKTTHPNVDTVYFRYKKFLIFSSKEYTDK